jgi:hypothetical protein
MVHRPSDSRLLTNLLASEAAYSKSLLALLASAQSSLSSFSAYASTSPASVSPVILAVAGFFSGAEDAVKRYAKAVELWREEMEELKRLEMQVGNVVRDREIL